LLQVIALLGSRTTDFSASTVVPTPRRPEYRGCPSHVINQNIEHPDALSAGEFSCYLEVHHIATVVLDDVKDASSTVNPASSI